MFKKKTKGIICEKALAFVLFGILFLIMVFSLVSAAPTGPDSVAIDANETKGAVSAYELNVSGGFVTTFNITSTTQNVRWKAMLGEVSGSFTLDDSTSSTIYDWSLSTVSGEVYATRNDSTIAWSNVQCANTTLLETENDLMNHTNANDNITKTFNDTTHAAFVVASNTITANTCPTLNTYVGNSSQDTSFEEMVLTDGTNLSMAATVIYSTIIEQDVAGFDSSTYDFQMIVPENGEATFTSSTAYYLYVELT